MTLTWDQAQRLENIDRIHVTAHGAFIGAVYRAQAETQMYVPIARMPPEDVAAVESYMAWRRFHPREPLAAGWLGAKPDGRA